MKSFLIASVALLGLTACADPFEVTDITPTTTVGIIHDNTLYISALSSLRYYEQTTKTGTATLGTLVEDGFLYREHGNAILMDVGCDDPDAVLFSQQEGILLTTLTVADCHPEGE